jgi:predicted protein tyrosine phosphatase
MDRPGTFVPFTITVCGIDELSGYCEVGVSHVLSILDPDYPEPTAFGAYGEHERLELRFHDIIDEQPRMIVPEPDDVALLLRFGRDLLAEPPPRAHLLVHCHAGVSRSTAAMALLLAQARPDRSAAEALNEVVRIRPQAWPNLRIIEIGDTLLGRGGDMVAAVRNHYRAAARRNPAMIRFMAEAGRHRELTGLDDGA